MDPSISRRLVHVINNCEGHRTIHTQICNIFYFCFDLCGFLYWFIMLLMLLICISHFPDFDFSTDIDPGNIHLNFNNK